MLSGFAKRGSALQSSPFELFSTDSNYLNYKYSLTCYLFSDRIWRVRFASARSRPLNSRQGTISFLFFLSASCKPSTANPFRFILFRTLCTNRTHRKRRISPVFSLLRTLAKTMGGWGMHRTLLLHSFAGPGNSSSYFSAACTLFTKTPRVYPNSSSPRQLFRRGHFPSPTLAFLATRHFSSLAAHRSFSGGASATI